MVALKVSCIRHCCLHGGQLYNYNKLTIKILIVQLLIYITQIIATYLLKKIYLQ